MNALSVPGNELWNLQGQLLDLMEERESIAERVSKDPSGRASAELAAIDSGISAYVACKVEEVNELRGCYFALVDGASVAEKEALRAQNRALVLQGRAENLKSLIKLCMETLGRNRFESALGFFRLQGNGGVQPLQVTNESLLPDELCNVEVIMSAETWKRLTENNPLVDGAKVTRIPSNSRIRKSLESACSACRGVHSDDCQSCGGSGKAGVPGARLEPRGKSVVIK